MEPTPRAEIERSVRQACERGDHEAALQQTIKGYGPELLGLLIAVHANEADANDAFSQVAEAIWKGLPRFAWDSSLRTWTYSITRNVFRTNRRDGLRRERRLARAGDSVLERLADQVRTETHAFLKTQNRTRLQALRDSLPEDDRILLILRVDRGLSWDELARVMPDSEDEGQAEPETTRRESARLRKRFQLVKERLRQLAKREGL